MNCWTDIIAIKHIGKLACSQTALIFISIKSEKRQSKLYADFVYIHVKRWRIILKFTKQEFIELRDDINTVLQPVAEKYALRMTAGNISYSEDRFSVKIECARTDAGDLEKKEFDKNCTLFGLSPDDYRREFIINADKHILVGLSLGSPKYPFICLNLKTNKKCKITEEAVKRALGK